MRQLLIWAKSRQAPFPQRTFMLVGCVCVERETRAVQESKGHDKMVMVAKEMSMRCHLEESF